MAGIGAQHLAGMQQEFARADAGKFLLDQKAFHHRLVHQRTFQQGVQGGNIPAPLVQGEQGPARRVRGADLEGLVEGIAGHQDRQGMVQDKQRFAHRLHHDLRERAGIFDLVEEHRHGHFFLMGINARLLTPL